MLQRVSFLNRQALGFRGPFARITQLLIAVMVTLVLGVLLGTAIASPSQETITALAVMALFLLLILAKPIVGLSIWLVVYPFLGERINLDLGLGLPDLTLTRFCVGLLALVLVAQIAAQRRPMFKVIKVDWAAFAFFLALGASTLVSDRPVWALQNTLDAYFIPLLVYFIARNLIETRRDAELVLSALLILGCYSAIYLIYQQTLSSETWATYSYGVRFVTGLLGGPHVFGLVFTMTLPFAMQRYLEARQPLTRAFYLMLSGLLLLGVFFSYKRGIWLAAVVSFLVIQFLHPRFRRFFFALLLIACVVLIFAGDQLSDSSAAQRFNDDLETGNNRTYMWQAAIDLWQKRPILGYGFGQFARISRYDVTENFYLNILVSAGLVGLLPFLALLFFVARDTALVYDQSKRGLNPNLFLSWELVAVFAGTATSYLVKAFSGNMAVPLPNIIFFLLIGIIVESQVSRCPRSVPDVTGNEAQITSANTAMRVR